jgi:ketosteroid isomerase-like protein
MTPQEAVIRNLYAAFAARDGAALGQLIADDAAWVVPGASPVAGTYRGRQAIFDYFAELGRRSGGTFRAELLDVLVGADSVAALARARGERAGRTYDGRYLLLCEVADGQVTRAVLLNEDPIAFDAFWA